MQRGGRASQRHASSIDRGRAWRRVRPGWISLVAVVASLVVLSAPLASAQTPLSDTFSIPQESGWSNADTGQPFTCYLNGSGSSSVADSRGQVKTSLANQPVSCVTQDSYTAVDMKATISVDAVPNQLSLEVTQDFLIRAVQPLYVGRTYFFEEFVCRKDRAVLQDQVLFQNVDGTTNKRVQSTQNPFTGGCTPNGIYHLRVVIQDVTASPANDCKTGKPCAHVQATVWQGMHEPAFQLDDFWWYPANSGLASGPVGYQGTDSGTDASITYTHLIDNLTVTPI